jgi:hypothetical protein
MSIQKNACTCVSCPGSSCTCGCQTTGTAQRSVCRCGEACACGPTCGCQAA